MILEISSLLLLFSGMDALQLQTDAFSCRFLCSAHFCSTSILWRSANEVSVVADFWEKNIMLIDLLFAWATAQSAGPFGHHYGGEKFTIRSFIKCHIIRANQIWWIYGLRLPIGKRFWRHCINNTILILWHLIHTNRRQCSDAVMPRDYQLGGWSSVTAFTVKSFSGEISYAWFREYAGTTWVCRLYSGMRCDLDNDVEFRN